jgi:surfactin synthase thioesterase subunit
MRDFAKKEQGYWLFEPDSPVSDSADLVVFLHGYGGYNPVLYGKWIKHLVAQGKIVVYPRYQKNLIHPSPNKFARNAAKAVIDAMALISSEGRTKLSSDRMMYIGHSYGGVTAANMGVDWQALGIPKPSAMVLVQPGSGPVKHAVKKTYAGLPEDLLLVCVVGHKDAVVGDTFSRLVMHTAVNTRFRVMAQHYSEPYKSFLLSSSHTEPYCMDRDMDIGLRNYTVNRGASVNRLNALDYYGYWKFADGLSDIVRNRISTDIVFGEWPSSRIMGYWFDGKPIRPLRIEGPDFQHFVLKRGGVSK